MAIRILVVDDSVVIRKLLTATLSEVPGLEVVATAGLGTIALAKIPQCNPDVVILDVEMPEMDGIETLKQIRKIAPRLPVIMFSTKTDRGAAATIEALTSGASDYVTKPSNTGSVLIAMQRVREEMVPKIHALTARSRAPTAISPPPAPSLPAAAAAMVREAGARSTLTTGLIAGRTVPSGPATIPMPITGAVTRPLPVATPGTTAGGPRHVLPTVRIPAVAPPTPSTAPIATLKIPTLGRPRSSTAAPRVVDGPIRLSRPAGPRQPIEIVAIGASTGGPNALATLLAQLPAEFPVPIVIVQHMLATFTGHFAERLAAQCRIQIVEANAGDVLVPGCAYIARGDHHLLVERRGGKASLAMNQGELENFCRPAADVLFRSVAQTYGSGALGVVLTGMGHDGLIGCGAIREAGGDVIVQDEASSVVWGMPGFVARAGLASQVMPLEQMGGEVRRLVGLGARGLESRS